MRDGAPRINGFDYVGTYEYPYAGPYEKWGIGLDRREVREA